MPMGFVPKYDDVVAAKSGICPEGRSDFSVSAVELTKSNSGAKQMVIRFIVDNGPNANYRIVDYFTFSEAGMEIAFENLKAIAEAAGMPWDNSVEELEDLAKHFAQPNFRFSAEVWHRHQMKQGNSYETCSKAELDAWKADGNEGNTRTNMGAYEPANGEPEIKVKVTYGKGDKEKAAPKNAVAPTKKAKKGDTPF